MRLTLLILLFSTLAITACSPVYKTKYRYTTPPTDIGKICASGCLDKQTACKANCKTEEASCRRIADLKSENRYLRYVEERRSEGKPIKKERWHFTSYSGCSSTRCENKCEESQRICHSSCGGNIIEERRCTAFCD